MALNEGLAVQVYSGYEFLRRPKAWHRESNGGLIFMVSAQVTIHTPHGLHLRPAGELAEEALKYRCRVSLAHGDKEISAKSLLGILSLCIRQDTEITVVCDGMDEQEALEGMVQFIEHL